MSQVVTRSRPARAEKSLVAVTRGPERAHSNLGDRVAQGGRRSVGGDGAGGDGGGDGAQRHRPVDSEGSGQHLGFGGASIQLKSGGLS